MITSSKEKEFQAKQEGNNNTNESKFSRATTSSSRQWSASRNPRIVRVSRTFGGKDRHSKVCTIRGLRDRRIRLSVPTAIQLYDLQDRLGLGQPSKVVDWLLDATKNDIDQLPPLQMPQGSSHFGQFFVQPTPQEANNNSTTNVVPLFFDENSPFKINDMNVEMERSSSSKHWDGRGDDDSRGKSKEVGRDHHRSMMMKVDGEGDDDEEEEENLDDGGIGSYNSAQVSAQNFFPIANQSSIIPGFLNMPYNSYYQWEPSNLSLSSSQFGFSDHSHHTSSNDNAPPPSHVSMVPSSLALSSGSQLIFCPPPTNTQTNTLLPSFFPTYNPSPYFTTPQESSSTSTSQQHISHYSLMQQQQPLHSSFTSPTMKSFPLNVNPRFLLPHPSHNINSTQSDKDKNVS